VRVVTGILVHIQPMLSM